MLNTIEEFIRMNTQIFKKIIRALKKAFETVSNIYVLVF